MQQSSVTTFVTTELELSFKSKLQMAFFSAPTACFAARKKSRGSAMKLDSLRLSSGVEEFHLMGCSFLMSVTELRTSARKAQKGAPQRPMSKSGAKGVNPRVLPSWPSSKTSCHLLAWCTSRQLARAIPSISATLVALDFGVPAQPLKRKLILSMRCRRVVLGQWNSWRCT